ncbi:hypothetical protein D3C75_1251650 [compost metagenome]
MNGHAIEVAGSEFNHVAGGDGDGDDTECGPTPYIHKAEVGTDGGLHFGVRVTAWDDGRISDIRITDLSANASAKAGRSRLRLAKVK